VTIRENLWLTLLVFFSPSWLIDQIRDRGLPEQLAVDFWQSLRAIHPGLGLAAGKTRGFSDGVPLSELIPKLPQIAAAIEALINKVEGAGPAA